jgi:hypothetical protein
MQLMEVATDVLASFHTMAHWHEEAVAAQLGQQQQQDAEASAAAAAAAEPGGGAGEQQQHVSAATNTTLTFLQAVSEMLAQSRAEVGLGRRWSAVR